MAVNFKNCLCGFFDANVLIAAFAILLVSAFPAAQITLGAVNMYECPAAPAIPVYVMVCGILALLIMALFAVPKLLFPRAQGSRVWNLSIFSLLLFIFIWFLYGSYQIYSVYPPSYIRLDPNTFNDTISTPAAPDNRPGIKLKEQDKSLPDLNHTLLLNPDPHANSTLRNLNQTLSLKSTNTEHTSGLTASIYCDRTTYLFAFWTTTLVYIFAGHALLLFICIYGSMKIGHLITTYFTT